MVESPLYRRGHDPRLQDFEFLGLGVHSYIAHLHRSRFFFLLLALLSVSSLVANGYGEELANKQINVATWLFTGTSLGNADVVSPSYGATELLITFLMTVFLYWAKAALDSDVRRVEQKQVTPADFGVMILNLPRDLAAGSGSFAIDTAGSFNRDWYITGGFMLVNGMFVDLFVITCLIQGWGLMLNVSRLFIAPSALTQAEMDTAYADVVDRLQLVTKFVVMCYICSAAIPLLNWVVLLVLTISITVDETNLLRRLYPAPQSDDTVVRVILVFVMPLAVLLHILAARVFFSQLRAPSTGVSLSAEFRSPITYSSNATLSDYLRSAASAFGHVPTTSFGSEDEDGLNFVLWSTWVNGPLAMIFIIREWPTFFRRKADSVEATEPDEGSTSQAHSTNAALNLRHADLEAIYRKAGRESELMYAPPDTSTLIAKLKRTEASPRGLSSAAPSSKPASPSDRKAN
eukprot:jgi/Chrpa1/9318/Chrysochromulina_OHIO_Genome00018478-RA